MSAEIMGVPLTRLEEPIKIALKTYQEISDNGLVFDADKACKLNLTPDRPNSARSETDAVFQEEQIKLYVIAFKPGDGTGSEVNYKLENLSVDNPYPRKTLIIPRNKTRVHSEGHLTIVRHKIDDVHAEPELFAGTFDLLGLDGNRIKKIGELGHSIFEKHMTPLATLTVGYGKDEKRFGDPHAVYSKDSLQVCAFLAISDAIHQKHKDILTGLKPELPRLFLTSFEWQNESLPVRFDRTDQVEEGVECDTYKFIKDDATDDTTKDLGIIRIQPGHKTPLQRFKRGERTIEGYISGKGKFSITRANIDTDDKSKTFNVGDISGDKFETPVYIGDLMQWQATPDSSLKLYEICYPPYAEGRYENIQQPDLK